MSKKERSMFVVRKVVLDSLIILGLTLCIFATHSSWHPFRRGFFCGDESIMFPYKNDTVSSNMLKIVGLSLPILGFIICEWALLRKQEGDYRILDITIAAWIQGFYCTAVSFGVGVCFTEIATNIAKNTIGRLRPHFLDLCKPSVDCSDPAWHGRYITLSDYECQGDRTEHFADMNLSFLSGHSAWSAYTMIYFALYLETRMVWRGTRVVRHVLQFAVVMLSWFTALSRISDYKHHWSDVLAGYCLGAIFAFIVWACGTDFVPKKKEHATLPQHDISLRISNQIAT